MGMTFDGALLADDLGYNTGPLISPTLYRNLVFPYHKRLCDRFAEDGLKTILHSDGDVSSLIPHFLDAGFVALNPLEVKAGLDMRKLYEQYGNRLIFYGNIDVRKLSGARAEVEEEVMEKLSFAREHGQYIYHSDHSVPHSVPFENYAYAVELVRRYGVYS
jgi:uroporphyrinogen decarboxylase